MFHIVAGMVVSERRTAGLLNATVSGTLDNTGMDRLLQEANGDMGIVKQKLGIPFGQWNEPLVRIDVMNPLPHDARLPSGLKSGANSQFQWGGYNSGGMPEIITNPIPKSDIRATIILGVK